MTLLDDVKTMLDINPNSTSEDNKLNIIIANGKQHLTSFNPLLTAADFEAPTRARTLLFAYCRYAYSNATEAFDTDWQDEILALRQEYEVTEYKRRTIYNENQDTD